MALTDCRECKHEISTEAPMCPNCGAPWPARAGWRGWGFEWKTAATMFGYPVIHVAVGRDARGRLRVARGIIAIGQFGIGVITIAQVGIGLLFGFGQVIVGLTALAQIAVAPWIAVGQLAFGYIAVGQLAFGVYASGMHAFGLHAWGRNRADPEAIEFFKELRRWFGWE